MFKIIERSIHQSIAKPFHIKKTSIIGGGCINSAYRLEGEGGSFFVKLNQAKYLAMFEAEALGLDEMAQTHTVRVPKPICFGIAQDQAYLVLECLNLSSGSPNTNRLLGQQLALMHRIEQPFFGWHKDNTIGSTPQLNPRSDDWLGFYARQRLGFQLDLAENKGFGGSLRRKGDVLIDKIPFFFSRYKPMPSLLHGDLWAGNFSSDDFGHPVIYDPACYYGDREADIAMTELFSGFGKDFYAAYREAFPLDSDYAVRKILYNLYHILNHLNLFGAGYLAQAENMIARLLSETS